MHLLHDPGLLWQKTCLCIKCMTTTERTFSVFWELYGVFGLKRAKISGFSEDFLDFQRHTPSVVMASFERQRLLSSIICRDISFLND